MAELGIAPRMGVTGSSSCRRKQRNSLKLIALGAPARASYFLLCFFAN
jgi:hypothetical protein